MSMFVKPRAGLKVRDPITKQHLPETGAKVPASPYWLRRLEAGDVFVVSKPVAQNTFPRDHQERLAASTSSPAKAGKGKE